MKAVCCHPPIFHHVFVDSASEHSSCGCCATKLPPSRLKERAGAGESDRTNTIARLATVATRPCHDGQRDNVSPLLRCDKTKHNIPMTTCDGVTKYEIRFIFFFEQTVKKHNTTSGKVSRTHDKGQQCHNRSPRARECTPL